MGLCVDLEGGGVWKGSGNLGGRTSFYKKARVKPMTLSQLELSLDLYGLLKFFRVIS